MNLLDLINYIEVSDLLDGERRWLINNLNHLSEKFKEKFGHDPDI